MPKAYAVKRHDGDKWGGMYDYTAKFASRDMAEAEDMWANREEHGKPVILIEYDDPQDSGASKRVVDYWSPDGVIPSTSSI